MKRTLAVIALTLAACLSTFAATPFLHCDSLVIDETGTIASTAPVEKGAASLLNQGADVHAIYIRDLRVYGSRLDDAEKFYESNCPTWVDAAGHRKANLFILMVTKTPRPAKNAVWGEAYSSIFQGDTATQIYSNAANPYFRQGQFAEGFEVAFANFGAKVAAYHDQQQHPVEKQEVVNNQATDYSGLWSFFKWLLFIVVIVAAVIIVFKALASRKREKEAADAAQRQAAAAQQRADTAFRNADANDPNYSAWAAEYQTLANSVSYDPNQDGLSAAAYGAIEHRWENLYLELRSASIKQAPPQPYQKVTSVTAPVEPEPTVVPEPEPPAPPVRHIHHHHTTVINSAPPPSNDGFVSGMLVGEALSHNNDDYYREQERERERQRRDEEERREARDREEREERRRRDEDSSSSSIFSSFGGSSSDSGFGSSSSFGGDSGGSSFGGDSGSFGGSSGDSGF